MRRKYRVIVSLDTATKEEAAKKIREKLGNAFVERIEKTRTIPQNRAMHLYFTQLAEALNDAGMDMRAVIRTNVEIPWTPVSIKEYLWRPVQNKSLRKKSTTELTIGEIDKIYEAVNRVVGERTGVHVPFPSIETLEEEANKKVEEK